MEPNKNRRVNWIVPPTQITKDDALAVMEVDGDIVGLKLTVKPDQPEESKIQATMNSVVDRLKAGERSFSVCLFQGYEVEVAPGTLSVVRLGTDEKQSQEDDATDSLTPEQNRMLQATMSVMQKKKTRGL